MNFTNTRKEKGMSDNSGFKDALYNIDIRIEETTYGNRLNLDYPIQCNSFSIINNTNVTITVGRGKLPISPGGTYFWSELRKARYDIKLPIAIGESTGSVYIVMEIKSLWQ